jgi:BirA family biotin operon repressor/biotin-[acetyl-CoA-carboxylase] ligase
MPVCQIDVPQLLNATFIQSVEHHASIDSTNDRAKQLAVAGPEKLPLLIVADQQTCGRGRGTHRWWTGRGSLAFTLLLNALEEGIPRARSPLVALATAVALAETVAPLLPGRTVGIHWPNDLYVEGRKMAGILVEMPSERYCVVGAGLNTNNSLDQAPAEIRPTVTTLRDLTGIEHDHTEILCSLLNHLAGLLQQLNATPESVAASANAMCLQQGQTLTLRMGDRTVVGTCRGNAGWSSGVSFWHRRSKRRGIGAKRLPEQGLACTVQLGR